MVTKGWAVKPRDRRVSYKRGEPGDTPPLAPISPPKICVQGVA